jgi:hypothetical protein
VVEVAQMLHEMIASCEAFVCDSITAGHGAWKLWGADAMYSGLVALEVGKAGEVCG